MPFKLSATLKAHSSDVRHHFIITPFLLAQIIPQVRAVVAPSDDLILSASRDSSAIAWIKSSESSFSPTYTFRAGSRFINSVAYLKPTPEAPQGENITY
jgi:phospholipase A-2-activating protein